VVILIIVGVIVVALLVFMAILVALLVPAVAKVREAAARTQTNNNMRQCAIAIHNYESTYKKLPSASWVGGIYAGPGKERTMWFHLLPYVECDNFYKRDAHNEKVSAYLAPSDPFITNENGKLNFAGNIRLFGYEAIGKEVVNNAIDRNTGQPSGQNLSGSLAPVMKSGLSLARIADGTSNTFMIATRYADCGGQSTYYSSSPTGTPLGGGNIGKGGYFGAGSHDRPADRGGSNRAAFQVAPKRDACIAEDAVFGHSFQSGGISIALADATVKSVDPRMTPTTFCRALCPSDGYPLDNDWLDD
jgi:hypothetical protein